MRAFRMAATLLAGLAAASGFAAGLDANPLAEVDMGRNAIIAKVLGSGNSDLTYTPLVPCRLIDTRGFGAPIQGGAFAPNERRAYVPGGQCGLPVTGVASMLISFTTQNLTPTSGGYLAILAPAAPVTATVDIFNFNSEWSASNTAVATGSAAQFDVFVSTASAHLVVDILGYFAPPAIGNLTLANSTASTGNILKGANRFIHNIGNSNTYIGVNAGNFTTTGAGNTGSGTSALRSITNGAQNTANGVSALELTTTANNNSACGAFALFSNTTGEENTALGSVSLPNNSTGSGNIAIGYAAGLELTTGNSNIHIGHPGAAGEGNTIRIGEAGQSRAFISGIRGTTTGVANAVPVLIDGNGQLGTTNSSRRFKDDIADMDASSSALMKLRPVTFHYKTDKDSSGRPLQYGLIAEEVADVYPGLVAHSADGEVETVMYQYLPSMLLNEYQKQQRTIEALTRHVAELTRQTAQLAKLLEAK